MAGSTRSAFLSGCNFLSGVMVEALTLATPSELSALQALRSCPRMILLSAEVTAESKLSDLVVLCCLKHITMPGAEMKEKTA